jgi:hypothetical protein
MYIDITLKFNLHRFKADEVALMIDWEDKSGSSASESEQDEQWSLSKAVSSLRERSTSPKESTLRPTHGSMRGLQAAIGEGWVVQRARDMCSFMHDRYRQIAQAEVEKMPAESIAKMSFRVRCSR